MNRVAPKVLVAVTFLALAAGFAAGWWMAGSGALEPEASPPHAVGAEEHIRLGMRALAAGAFGEAENRFRDAARLAPEDPAPHADLAVALLYQERWEEARGELGLARRYGPDLPEVAFLEGILYRDGLGDTTRAREAWQRFLALVPEDSPQAATVRGWLAELGGAPSPGGPTAGDVLDRATGVAAPALQGPAPADTLNPR